MKRRTAKLEKAIEWPIISAWRGLGNIVLAGAVIVGPLLLIVFSLIALTKA